MSPEPRRFPNPMIDMSPAGLPGFYVVLLISYGFSQLFVSRDTAENLLLVVLAIAFLVSGYVVFQALRNRG